MTLKVTCIWFIIASLSGAAIGANVIACRADDEDRAMQGASQTDWWDMTQDSCVQFCYDRGFRYAGAEAGHECYCDNWYWKYDEVDYCLDLCSGDWWEGNNCGGGWALTVMDTGYSPCNNNPCVNGGACIANGQSYSCQCPAPWGGYNCEIYVNPCDATPCANGGACTPNGASFTCACVAPYTGSRCEVYVNPCDATPCANGGACTPNGASFTCACVDGWTGSDCSTDVNECSTNNGGCSAQATCTNSDGGFTCACIGGFHGDGVTCAPNTPNSVALNQRAIQSNTYNAWQASLAVDNSISTVACSVQRSNLNFFHWWAVDLGTPKAVSVIVVTNDNNANYPRRLENFKAGVSNTEPTVGQAYTSYVLCEQYSGNVPLNGTVAVQCPKSGSTYRYVIIQSTRANNEALCLADVKVYTDVPTNAVGCYKDEATHDLDGAIWQGRVTIEKCVAYCSSQEFKYAGLQNKQSCLCGNTYGRYGTATCNAACTADPTQTCGDEGASSVYLTGL